MRAQTARDHATEPLVPLHPDEVVRYQRPELAPIDDIARYYALAEEARFYSNGGPCATRLATRLAEFIGADVACVPVANCTLGLMVALREACGEPVGRRRFVVVPSFSFTATACAVRWAGFEPLFADVDECSWQMDPGSLEAALGAHPGAVAGVLGCSTFGTAAPTPVRAGWRAACERHGVPLLLDSAAGFGAVDDHGRPLGSLGDVEVFSFHATKPFAIGEGGLIAVPGREAARRVERLVNFGLDDTRRASEVAGINGKMSELHAAAALAMLDRYSDVLGRRRATACELQQRLAEFPLTFQHGSEASTWQVFQALAPDADTRARLVQAAATHRVEARTCFDPPLHRHPAFASAAIGPGGLAVTDALAARAISLPMANSLGPRQMERIAAVVSTALGGSPC